MSKDHLERLPATEPEPAAPQAGTGYPGHRPSVLDPRSFEFLLRCLAVGVTPLAVSGQVPAIWNDVVAIAASHGLAPLLYARLKQKGAQALVPADAWERLRRDYRDSAVRSMFLHRELRPVLRCLRDAGIKVIVLKGVFLAEAVYSDAALRSMADVDLMVPRAELPRANALLLDLRTACNRSGSAGSLLSRDRKYLLSPGAGIDFRWTIDVPAGRSRLDLAGLWDRARPASIAGVEVLAFSPEDLLLHVCLHAAHRHGLGDGLRPICDAAETVQRFGGELDWAQVTARAREWGAARYVGLTLRLARSMLAAAVPDDILEQLVPGGIDQRILEAASNSVLAKAGYLERMPFFDRLGARTFGERTKLSWERVFLSRQEMAARYPASLNSKHLWFYYALRLRDVTRTYAAHAFRRTRLTLPGRGRSAELVRWLAGRN